MEPPDAVARLKSGGWKTTVAVAVLASKSESPLYWMVMTFVPGVSVELLKLAVAVGANDAAVVSNTIEPWLKVIVPLVCGRVVNVAGVVTVAPIVTVDPTATGLGTWLVAMLVGAFATATTVNCAVDGANAPPPE